MAAVSSRSRGAGTVARPMSEVVKARRRAADNARKRMLRRAGVYGDPNRARNERKLEIAYLREKVGQLEMELQNLQGRPGQKSTAITVTQNELKGKGGSALTPTSSNDIPVSSIWQGFAERQRNRREQTERENVRLKLALEGQIKVAKSLENLLLKRAQQQVGGHCFLVHIQVLTSSGCIPDFRADAADFQELLQYLDAAYSEVDAVLADNGLNTMEMTQQDLHVREGVNGMYLDVFSNKVMPFGLHATAEATWNYFKGSEKHRGNLYAKTAQSNDTGTVQYSVMTFLQDEDAARAFEAALSFVDEYPFQDGEHAPPGAPGHPESGAVVIGPQPAEADDKMQRRARANAKKRLLRKTGLYDDPNRARKERRLEMAFLQRKVEQLQQELEALQLQKPSTGEPNAQQKALVARQVNPEVSTAWKEVASRQREQRDKAEKENVRLRLVVERQQKLAEALETLVQARIKQQSLDTPFTIIEDYAKELFANTARADVRVKQIVRRYVEADREIVILVASVSPVSIAHKPLAGLTFNYRCYALIKRAAAATEDHDLSLLQLCTLASLADEVQTYDPAYTRALSNFVLGNTAGNIKADQELIENVLVGQVLNQRG
ncbi:unnamed protein product [Phytophthora fragariaefolia]|uniref:Unnamed protein product n=1 Tax=Phytophthora fragariaefolia TaxID=1490495 RepID=A0A9W6X8W8_9STRA|nr:unnamed protein product [Phytophthora fragariaefolia]